MKCSICGCENIKIIFDDKIRNGAFGQLTDKNFKMFQCVECETIWHDFLKEDYSEYYETEKYRKDVLGEVSAEYFYQEYDKEVSRKIQWIGTDGVRGKIIADIGCAGGALLDFYSGVAKDIVAVEPSEIYRTELKRKDYRVYPYMTDAITEGITADIITCFDVIEHVENPVLFMHQIYDLCTSGGSVIIGTPTEHKIMRELMGHSFDQFHFRYQHPWVLTKKAMIKMSEDAGFKVKKCLYKQRYNLSNLFI